jgi:glycolate oxidase iron-sulfur subunit
MMIDTALKGELKSQDSFNEHLSSCLGCYTCETICPSGIEYGDLLSHCQSELLEPSHSIKTSILLKMVNRPWLLQIMGFLAALIQRLKIDIILKKISPQFWGLPLLPFRGFKGSAHEIYPAINKKLGVVAFFTGCVMDNLYPHIHEATIRILQWNGYEVHIPKSQGCCGALHHHTGKTKNTADMQTQNIQAFQSVDTIILNSAGCGAELKSYPQAFASKVKDISEFLDSIDLKLPKYAPLQKAIYDAPCHLIHAQKIDSQPSHILAKFGIELLNFPQSNLCCGAAGSYTLDKPKMSAQILKTKMGDIQQHSESGLIITTNPGCQMQLQKGTELHTKNQYSVSHIIEVIDGVYANDSTYVNAFNK